jgi:hypothetical protein
MKDNFNQSYAVVDSQRTSLFSELDTPLFERAPTPPPLPARPRRFRSLPPSGKVRSSMKSIDYISNHNSLIFLGGLSSSRWCCRCDNSSFSSSCPFLLSTCT